MTISKDLPYTKTNIEGVDRYEDTIRLWTGANVELSPGAIRLYTFEDVCIEHNVNLTNDTILRNKTRLPQYIELSDNMIGPCVRTNDKKELHITHEQN
jgi:hypothetical protein